ncbi:MAG: hypothetical protein ABI910_10845 [Gemmatimonadota bacterium]
MSPAADTLSTRRPGVALFAVLVAVLLLALLAIGSMTLGRGDFLRSRDERVMRSAANAADAGAYDLLRRWPSASYASMPVGATIGPDTLVRTGASAVSRTTRASRALYWTVSVGSSGDSLAHTLSRRAVQVAYRLALPDLLIDAALIARDSVSVIDSARVVGTDTAIAGWGASCATPSSTAAITMADTSRLCDGGCGVGSVSGRIVGAPALRADSSAANSARYRVFGSETWATLTRHAGLVIPAGSVVTPAPVVVGATCDRTRADNWGAPGAATSCATYAPLIWARGDLEMRGGVGQGVLLVDGDFTLSAGALFAGVVITRDDLRTLGVGGTVLGAVLAGDASVASGDHTTLGGMSRLQRSHCAVEQALEWSARLVPVRQRAWAALRD